MALRSDMCPAHCYANLSQCDKAAPSCSQCVRARRTCSGYRDRIDLIFRNQNEYIIEKVKSKARRATRGDRNPHALVQSIESSGDVDGIELEDAVISISRQHLELPGPLLSTISHYVMTPTVEQRARGFFQAHSKYWLRNTDLLDGMVSQTQGEEHLLASMYAVGLASYSNYVHSDKLMARAREGYTSALRLTNAAIKSPTDAKRDSTLFAIMILGIYETIAGNNARSVQAWESHIRGAVALVEFRGLEQFKTDAGQRMFFQAMSNMLILCLQRNIMMPAGIIDLRNAAERIIQPSHALWDLSGIMIDVTVLRANVRESRIELPSVITEVALSIDKRFEDVFSHPPPEWRYTTEHTDDSPHLVWNKSFYKFPQSWILQIWNGMRACRIILHEMILEQIYSSSSIPGTKSDLQESSSVAICLEMQRDILRSIPRDRPSTNHSGEPGSELAGRHHAYILWPLYQVGVMSLATERVKKWVIDRLRLLSEEGGIRQAAVLASSLERREHL